MYVFNEELTQNILKLTWRNPAFMAIAIGAIWMIPQLLIRKTMQKNFEKSKLTYDLSNALENFIFKQSLNFSCITFEENLNATKEI